nr:MAG TPA: hypothetical protein [Caudoviricetes sp.]
MKYTVNGYSQEALIKNGLDLIDSLILRTLSDMYLSNSKKIDYKILENEVEERELEGEKKDNKDKFMWIKYSYLFEQIPIVGSERTIIRRIDKLIKKKILKKRVLNCRNGVKGTFLYVALNESYSDLTEYEDKMSSEGMTNWQDKDSSINDSSITSSSKEENVLTNANSLKEKVKKELQPLFPEQNLEMIIYSNLKNIMKLINNHGNKLFWETLSRMKKSKFLTEDFKNKRNPGAFCLWLFKENNFLNICIGTYDDNSAETRVTKSEEQIAKEYDFSEFDNR